MHDKEMVEMRRMLDRASEQRPQYYEKPSTSWCDIF